MFFSRAEVSKERAKVIMEEEQAVKNFLAFSYEFKKMKSIAERQKNNPEFDDIVDFVGRLAQAKSYQTISDYTSHWDFPNNDNLFAYNLGRNKVNALMYIGGFISDRINFGYYALHLRENAKIHRKENFESSDTYRRWLKS